MGVAATLPELSEWTLEVISTFTTAVWESWNVNDKYTWDNAGDLKVGSHDPISIQLTLKIFVCVMEFVGVHTIQFLIQLFRDELEKL